MPGACIVALQDTNYSDASRVVVVVVGDADIGACQEILISGCCRNRETNKAQPPTLYVSAPSSAMFSVNVI